VDADVDCTAVNHKNYVGLCAGQAIADFSNTLVLTGIAFEDANGNAIPGFGLTSSSGSDYSSLILSNQIAAPEPSSLWLLLPAGLLLCAMRLRYSASRSPI
jgi:hypothetical protein